MALAPLTRTYSSHVNIPFPDVSSSYWHTQSICFLLKQALLNGTIPGGVITGVRPPASVWTTYFSGVTTNVGAPGDGVDRWGTTYATLAPNIFPSFQQAGQSWYVFRNQALDLYLLIATYGSGASQLRIELSIGTPYTIAGNNVPVGTNRSFVVGLVTNPTGRWDLSTQILLNNDSSGALRYASFSFADDGSFRFLISRGGIFRTILSLERLAGARPNDLNPWMWFHHTFESGRGAGSYPLVDLVSPTNAVSMRHPDNSNVSSGGGINRLSFAGSSSAAAFPYPGSYGVDALVDEYLTFPTYVFHTFPSVVYRGQVPDMYWIGTAPVGASVPTVAAQTRVIVGDLLVPMPGPQILF